MKLKALLLALSVTFIGACSKGGGGGSLYSNVMTGTYETAASFMFTTQAVKFTISWNESSGVVTGVYQDDYFAPNGISIKGVASNGSTSFSVPLAAEKDGVATITFAISKQGEKNIASVKGLSSSGGITFADDDVELSGTASSGTGTGDPTSVAGFFESIAGEYNWFATRSGGSDDQWKAGKTYKVIITKDKKITLPSEKGDIEIVYGSEASDTFESYDHESYIIATRGDCKFLVQFQEGDDEPFMSCRKGNQTNSPFWKFTKEEGASTGVLAEQGLGGAVGDYAWVVKSASPVGSPDIQFPVGTEFKFKVDADGNITSDFGDFPYDTFSKIPVSSGGTTYYEGVWYSPSKTATNRKEFVIGADNDKIISVRAKDESKNVIYIISESL